MSGFPFARAGFSPQGAINRLCRSCALFAREGEPLGESLFRDADEARALIERTRWPNGVRCPRCEASNIARMGGRTSNGMFLCRKCHKKFTCRIGNALAHSHIPLEKWLLALHLLANGEVRLSPQQLKSRLDLGSYRTAWLMAKRIRDSFSNYYQSLERANRREGGAPPPCASSATNLCGDRWRPSFAVGLKALLMSEPESAAVEPDARGGASVYAGAGMERIA